MKKWMAVIAVCCLAVLVNAAEWLTDFPKALALAKAEKKMVLLDFNGSDWCPDCIRLHNKVLVSPEFIAYANTNLILVDVDFPQKKVQTEELKKANDELAKKYNVEAFPTLVVLDSGGAVLTTNLNYDAETPKEFIAKLEKLKKQQ